MNIALLCGSLFFCFLVIEICYRFLDPFPYYSEEEINNTQHGNLSDYDDTLGWRGVPRSKMDFITRNNRISLVHNQQGFRDVEHDAHDSQPAIVFLGDSFTWGFEVGQDKMFVSRLRELLPKYNIFNLAHRGYGTDQELIVFGQWHYEGPIRLVVLMFCENDATENNSNFRYEKYKPRFEQLQDELVLRGVPVPKISDWTDSLQTDHSSSIIRSKIKRILFASHFIHDLSHRYSLLPWLVKRNQTQEIDTNDIDLTLTFHILQKLKREVELRNARLIVFFIPSKREIKEVDDSPPYQIAAAELCQKLEIEHVDLAPYFKKRWDRTYYRYGMHWNSRGHQVATEAIYQYLSRSELLRP